MNGINNNKYNKNNMGNKGVFATPNPLACSSRFRSQSTTSMGALSRKSTPSLCRIPVLPPPDAAKDALLAVAIAVGAGQFFLLALHTFAICTFLFLLLLLLLHCHPTHNTDNLLYVQAHYAMAAGRVDDHVWSVCRVAARAVLVPVIPR
ncbi:hypothetical protein NQ176_g5773 [Zarea fungicola]|uniref:Uncharacterized protein n=1 Tax=Zarea fungicola TaxID=93591 RepID=A0ACC1N7K6_9HYPO|nr:hypothetical protein NQ176_g5773 [Lecanicillium fungicola]